MASLIRDSAASTPQMLEVFGDDALIKAALAFEASLARAEAEEGLIAEASAAAVVQACGGTFAIDELAAAAAHAGTLAIPLTAELRRRLASDPAAAEAVHKGATSQDLADTALMLQAKGAMALVAGDLERACRALRRLAQTHAATPMVGRTLLQSALPITFGLKAANWLTALDSATARLNREADAAIALQFGGATGARAGLEGKGAALAARMAADLGLANPVLPWQSRREGVAALGCALAIVVGVLGKIARDISLLAQNEVAEASEPRVAGRGGSSAMAHKRNPTGCQVTLSAALRAPGLAATLLTALPSEHERGLGGWQAEAPVLAELFQIAHGAVMALANAVEGLEVDATAMARNLAAADVGSNTGEAEAMVAGALNRPARGT